MKKIIAMIISTVICASCVVSATAVNDTAGSTILSYSVLSSYNITIPPSVTLTGGTGSGEVRVNQNSLIDANTILKFTITGATNYDETDKFRMKNSSDESVFLKYSIKDNDENSVVKDTAFLSANPDEAYDGKAVTLTYTTETPKSAGEYSDTITITVGAVDRIG